MIRIISTDVTRILLADSYDFRTCGFAFYPLDIKNIHCFAIFGRWTSAEQHSQGLADLYVLSAVFVFAADNSRLCVNQLTRPDSCTLW